MSSIKVTFAQGPMSVQLEGTAEALKDCLGSDLVCERIVDSLSDAKSDAIDEKAFERSLEHAWNWFALHADQRMKSVNFFIVTIAFLTAAYVSSLRFSQPLTALVICAVGLILTVCFSRFDLRIRELLEASENVLAPLQQQLATQTGIDSLRMSALVKKGKLPFTRYSRVIGALHITAGAMFLLGALWAVLLTFGVVRESGAPFHL